MRWVTLKKKNVWGPEHIREQVGGELVADRVLRDHPACSMWPPAACRACSMWLQTAPMWVCLDFLILYIYIYIILYIIYMMPNHYFVGKMIIKPWIWPYFQTNLSRTPTWTMLGGKGMGRELWMTKKNLENHERFTTNYLEKRHQRCW